ncbi:hypothetical protein D3C77_661920 [compost metagenome]
MQRLTHILQTLMEAGNHVFALSLVRRQQLMQIDGEDQAVQRLAFTVFNQPVQQALP